MGSNAISRWMCQSQVKLQRHLGVSQRITVVGENLHTTGDQSVRGEVFSVKVNETEKEETHSREKWVLPYTGEGKQFVLHSDKVGPSNVMNGKDNDQSSPGTAIEGLDTILEITLCF